MVTLLLVIAVIGLCSSDCQCLCMCVLSDMSPLPASTVPVLAEPCFIIDAPLPYGTSLNQMPASTTRRQRVRRNVLQVADTACAGVTQQQGSASSVAASASAVSQNSSYSDAGESASITRRRSRRGHNEPPVNAHHQSNEMSLDPDGALITRQSWRGRNKRLMDNVDHQSDETSSDAISVGMSAAGEAGRNSSDSSANSGSLLRLQKSSMYKTAVVKNAGFMLPVVVVEQSADAAAAAAAAAAACGAVMLASSSDGAQHTRGKTRVNEGSKKVGASSRHKRRRLQSVDRDVEPDDETSTDNSASCMYCCKTFCYLATLFSG